MPRQGMCRHNASSGGRRHQGAMRRQGMCRHNASSGGNASSEGNASSGNVSSECIVKGAGGHRQCVVTMCRQRQLQKSYPSCGRPV